MTDHTRLDEIRARVEAATPGPWTTKTLHTTLADADFIAASRTDVPFLLNLVASLTAERDALRDRYEPLRSWADGAEIDIRDLADQRDDLRAQLAQRDEELTALREKVRAVYELVTLFDYTAVYDLKCDLLAALSDNQEGQDG